MSKVIQFPGTVKWEVPNIDNRTVIDGHEDLINAPEEYLKSVWLVWHPDAGHNANDGGDPLHHRMCQYMTVLIQAVAVLRGFDIKSWEI